MIETVYKMLCSVSLSDWGDIGNIILGISSFLTAIVTAIVLFKQHKLQIKQHLLEKDKLNAQQMEHQPLFQFKKTDEMLTITNAGSELSAPVNVKLHSMIVVQTKKIVDDFWQNCIYCHVVSYYDLKMSSTGQLKGEVAIAIANKDEHVMLKNKISELDKALSNWRSAPADALMTYVTHVDIVDVIQIDYVDMYQISRTAYFWNSQPISKTRFDQLVELSTHVPNGLYSAKDININYIIERVYYTNDKLNE